MALGSGQPSRLDGTHRVALAAVIESGLIPAMYGVVCWRVIDLCQWVLEGVPDQHRSVDAELRIAGDGLPHAVCPAAPSYPSWRNNAVRWR